MASVAWPDTQRLVPSRFRAASLLVGSIMFVATGIGMRAEHAVGAWFVIAFFGLCALVGVVLLLPGSSWLELRADGFEIRSLFRTSFVRWRDIDRLTVAPIGTRESVCWHFAPDYPGQRAGRQLSAALTGVEGALPDTYGLSAHALAERMNAYRDAAARSA